MSYQTLRNVHSSGSWRGKRKGFFRTRRRGSLFPRPSFSLLLRVLFFPLILIVRMPRQYLKTLVWFGILGMVLAGSIVTISALVIARNLPEPGRLLERTVAQSTKIYDRTGEVLLYDVHGAQKRTAVTLAQMSPYVKWATISAEDKRFYEHSGFNLKSMLRAVLVDIAQGGKKQGASTITQQFVKNAVLTGDKSFTRKLKELILSYRIEKKFTKDQILEMYLNEIPYGSTSYGIEAAAQTFLGKNSKDLDLVDAAVLAALPKAPSYYSPFGTHRDELIGRAQYIIGVMREEGYISKEDADAAMTQDIAKRFVARREAIKAPHFVLYVKELLAEKYGEDVVEQGGLKITTTLDYNFQKIAEEEVAKGAAKNEKQYNATNAALVSMDPKTGQVLAMVGSRDYFDEKYDGNVNVALRPRQPGSSFKPIVYAAAFEKGYTPETILYDVETTFKTETKDYTPHNYDGKEHGPLTMRKAMAGSLNIPAVKTIYLTGINRVLDLAARMGYTTLDDRSRFGLSLVLGGGEVKLLEHTNAFGVFAREGAYIPTSSILKVEDKDGKMLEEWNSPSPDTVMSKNTARQIESIMSDNEARTFIFGAASPLILPNRPVAAKTGTTNDWHDGWTVGYTPSLVTGVWAGNNDNAIMKRGADGVLVAAPIWHAFMVRALKDKPVEAFTPPDPVSVDKPVLRGEDVGRVRVKIDSVSGRLATEFTPPEFVVEKVYTNPHSILYFVNKDDPRGSVPAHPEEDPNFVNFEQGVQRWTKAQGWVFEDVPTQYDDVHTKDNLLQVSFVTPQENATVSGDAFDVEVAATGGRGIKKIEFALDGQAQAIAAQAPFKTSISLGNIGQGTHMLTATAYDDALGQTSISRTINVVK